MEAQSAHGDEAQTPARPVDEDKDWADICRPGQAIGKLLQESHPLPPPVPGEGVRAGGRRGQAKGTRPAPERAQVLRTPMQPSRTERERHEVCHLPCADWCRHCVMARSLSSQHRTKKHTTKKEVPVVSGDFCFMGREEQDGTHPIHVMRDHDTRNTFAHMV